MPHSHDAQVARRLRLIADEIDADRVLVKECKITHADEPSPVHGHVPGINMRGTVNLTYESTPDASERILQR